MFEPQVRPSLEPSERSAPSRAQLSPVVGYYLRKVLRGILDQQGTEPPSASFDPTADLNQLLRRRYPQASEVAEAIATLERLVQYHQVLSAQGNRYSQERQKVEREILGVLEESTANPAISATIVRLSDRPEDSGIPTHLLRQRGYGIQTLSDTQPNWSAIANLQPHAIIIDTRTAEQGYELCRQLRGQPALQSIPVLMMSSLQSASDRVKAFKIGASDYVVSPAPAEEILARLDNRLQQQRQCQSLQTINQQLQDELQTLRQSHWLTGLFQQILETRGDYHLLIDSQNRIVYASAGVSQHLGYSRDVFLHMRMADLDPRLTPTDWSTVWNHLQNHQTLSLESIHISQSGQIVNVQLDLQHLSWQEAEYAYLAVQRRE